MGGHWRICSLTVVLATVQNIHYFLYVLKMVHILCWNAPSTKLQLKERVQQDFRRPVIFIIRLYCTWATDQRVSKFHRVVRIKKKFILPYVEVSLSTLRFYSITQ